MKQRTVMAFSVALVGVASGGLALAATDDDKITGTWNVTAKIPSLSTCSGLNAVGGAFQWILTSTEGQVRVSVQGETQFSLLGGSVKNDQLSVVGQSASPASASLSNLFPSAVWKVTFNKDRTAFTGQRYLLHVTQGLTANTVTPCLGVSDVTGKKQ